ncbi:MAG: hypothetical protein JXQ87_03450 [Bacteroidia bacterium]
MMFIFNLAFLIFSPFTSLFYSLRRKRGHFNKWFVVLFIVVFGSNMIKYELADSARYIWRLENYYVNMDLARFFDEFWGIISFSPLSGSYAEDPFILIVSYLFGSVLNIPGMFYPFISFIYGFFFVSSLEIILSKTSTIKLGFWSKILFWISIVILLSWKNLEGINTVRTWTGMWVLIYGFLKYLSSKKIKYVLLILLTTQIHFAYYVMSLPIILYLVIGRIKVIYFGFFILSIIIQYSGVAVFGNTLGGTDLSDEKLETYSVEERGDVDEETKYSGESRTWYKLLYANGLQNNVTNVLILFIILNFNVIMENKNRLILDLFFSGVLMKSLANSTILLTALSNRSNIIAGVLIFSSLVLLIGSASLNKNTNKFFFKLLLGVLFLFFIPLITYKLAELLYWLQFGLFIFPFYYWLFPEDNISLRELIGKFI